MSRDNEIDFLMELRQSVEQLTCPDGPLQPSLQAFSDVELKSQDAAVAALRSLTKHFYLAGKVNLQYAAALGHVLAEATKKHAFWRTLFGLPIDALDKSPESLLHVALGFKQFDRRNCAELIKDCLRLIANCCANNNVNRKFSLEHGVVADLIELATYRFEIDILVPTLYNICADYEDPVNDAVLPVSESQHAASDGSPAVSLASRKLLETSIHSCTSYQVLLSIISACSEDRRAYLAELVELACLPIAHGITPVIETEVSSNAWKFESSGEWHNTLYLANTLAQSDDECRYHMLRAVTFVLTNEEYRKELLINSAADPVWEAIIIASSSQEEVGTSSGDFNEEITESRKHFLKVFYELTGSPELVTQYQATEKLVAKCIQSLSSSADDTIDPGRAYQRTCSLIVLAQLAASQPLRLQLVANHSLNVALSQILQLEEDNDILYPTITLISRLCRIDEHDLILVQDSILQPMIRLMGGKGRGLIIPFEVVNTYKMMIRNRPHYFKLFMKTVDSNNISVISGVVELFEKTIEAGTKLEVGHFFIELLRTMFAQAKDLDNSGSASTIPEFDEFMNVFAIKIGEILTFVCSQAEPKEQRVHGWFGLGMLSVWSQGRTAIVLAIDRHGLGDSLINISKTEESAAVQNARLLLSKMQKCPGANLSSSTISTLQDAAKNLGLDVRFSGV